MKVVLNEIKSWKKLRKCYYKEAFKSCKKREWSDSEIWIKLLKVKTSKECKKIIEEEFDEKDIMKRISFYCLFCKVWVVMFTNENKEIGSFILGKEENPTVRKLKKMMKKNNYREIELRSSLPMVEIYQPVVKILR